MNIDEEPHSEKPGAPQHSWPPAPDGDPMMVAQAPDSAEIKALVRKARLLCILGLLVFSGLQPFTIYFALKANRVAGRNVANGFIIVAAIQLCIVACVIMGYIVSATRR